MELYLSLKYAILQNQKKFKKLLTNNNAYVSIYELSLRNDKRTTKFFKKKLKKLLTNNKVYDSIYKLSPRCDTNNKVFKKVKKVVDKAK